MIHQITFDITPLWNETDVDINSELYENIY